MFSSARDRVEPIQLNFSDEDLTDNHQDHASSIISQGANRHPRGDSPISIAGSAFTASTHSIGNGTMPSLDRLMAFLDDDEVDERKQSRDEDGEAATRLSQGAGISPTKTQNQAATFQDFRAALHSTSISVSPPLHRPTPLSHPSQAQLSPSSSPPLRTRSRQLTEEERLDLPDSPSPQPGSMSYQQSQNQSGRRSVGGLMRREESGKGKEKELLKESGEQGETEMGENMSDETPESIRRVAEEVLNEFDSIISRHSPDKNNQTLRPPSRLRNIPSPLTSHSGGSKSSNSNSTSDEERKRGVPLVKARRRENHPTEKDLLEELSNARSYISHLQNELKDIGNVVMLLQSQQGRPLHLDGNESPRGGRGSLVGLPDDQEVPYEPVQMDHLATQDFDASPQDVWDLARHIFNILPSPPKGKTSLHSIADAIRFTRDIDEIVWGGERSEKAVFEKGNLEGLRARVRGWEREVRGR